MATTSATSSLSSSFGTLDVNTLVSQLMTVERQPETLMQNRQLQVNTTASALDSLANDVSTIKAAATNINAATQWEPLKTTSSSSAVSTSATNSPVTGAFSFKVMQLATNQQLYSASTVSSTNATVIGASQFLVAAGMGPMGFSTVKTGTGLALGNHTVAVTQASAAATKTGASISGATIVQGVNDTVNVSIAGQSYTLNLATGTYSGPKDVADAVNNAIAQMGGGAPGLQASVDNGKLVLSTTNEGSAASIQVTGGSALTDLGLTVDAAASTGTDGKVTVDGTETVLKNISAGSAISLAAPAGTIDAVLAGGVRMGSASVTNVDTSGGSLSAIVSAINNAGGGVAAAAINAGSNSFRLQIQSKATGTAGRLNVDLSAFTGFTGFASIADGNDASIQVQGSTPYTVTSTSNTFADVMPGVSFTLNNSTTDVVTISATRDSGTLATRIQTLVDSINSTFADIKVKTAFNSTNNTAGTLLGDSSTQRLQQQLSDAVTRLVGSSSVKLASSAGLTLASDGKLSFDQAKFQTAYAADPNGVQRLFVSDPSDPDPGITQRLGNVATSAIDTVSGYLTTSAAQQHSIADGIGKQIDAFEVRMTMRETALKAQYNALNVALQELSSQSSSLASQLAQFNPSSSTTG